MLRRCLLVFLLLLVPAVSVHRAVAQESADTSEVGSDSTSALPSYRLEEVLVTAAKLSSVLERVPAAVSVIGRREIEQSAEKGLFGILEEREGVNSGSYGSFGALELVSLRGGRSGRTATLLDGVPVNNTQNGVADLYSVSPFLLERVEILRGPLGSLHGGNGVTGVVNLVSAEPTGGEEPVATVGVSSGSLAYRKVAATFARRYGGLGTFLGIEEGACDGAGAYRDYSGKNRFAKVSYDFGARGRIACLFSAYSGVLRTVREAKQKSNVDRFQVVSSMSIGAEKRLEVRAFRSMEMTDYVDPFVSTVSELERYGTLLDLYAYGTTLGDVGLGAGYTESHLSCKDASGSWNPDTRQGYLIAQNQVAVGKDLNALFSLRADNHSTFGTEISPHASLWREGANERIWLSFGRGFNPPTLNDLFWPTQRSVWAGWTYVTTGNRGLDAESSWMVELGSDFAVRNGALRGGLAAFLSGTSDFIEWSSVESEADSMTTYTPLNLEEVNVRGVEGHVVVTSDGEDVACLNVTLQRVERETAELLPYMPELRVNSWFTRSLEPFPELFVTFRLDATYVGEYLEPTGISEPPLFWSEGPFFLLEERLSASVAGFTAYLRVRNMTDEQYPSRYLESPYTEALGRPVYYPMPGRQYEIGMTWRLVD
ncbi:MAG: TonB-dependent receptor [Candidatus Eiseniibacteriota bacterium]|nr:MAG: TonB-dependent receptor [Candidatus Eisenbacteria bacterium]